MKWTSKNGEWNIDLTKVDAYRYIKAVEFVKTKETDHPAFNTFKMYGNHLCLYINGSEIELNGEDADSVYNILNPPRQPDTMD
jgi:hypothetical protein